jgi:hypothetical protein
MDIKIETKMVIETSAYFHDGSLKTHPCDLYEWWGEETCKKVDFTSEIENVTLPEGEYKITITLEKIN